MKIVIKNLQRIIKINPAEIEKITRSITAYLAPANKLVKTEKVSFNANKRESLPCRQAGNTNNCPSTSLGILNAVKDKLVRRRSYSRELALPALPSGRDLRPLALNKGFPVGTELVINLYFVKNSTIKKLNRQFFHKDCLTDVISFNLTDCAEVFIAPLVVKTNASIFKVELREELFRCIIHGLLHVLGFKDKTKKDKALMWKKQESIVKKIFASHILEK